MKFQNFGPQRCFWSKIWPPDFFCSRFWPTCEKGWPPLLYCNNKSFSTHNFFELFLSKLSSLNKFEQTVIHLQLLWISFMGIFIIKQMLTNFYHLTNLIFSEIASPARWRGNCSMACPSDQAPDEGLLVQRHKSSRVPWRGKTKTRREWSFCLRVSYFEEFYIKY